MGFPPSLMLPWLQREARRRYLTESWRHYCCILLGNIAARKDPETRLCGSQHTDSHRVYHTERWREDVPTSVISAARCPVKGLYVALSRARRRVVCSDTRSEALYVSQRQAPASGVFTKSQEIEHTAFSCCDLTHCLDWPPDDYDSVLFPKRALL